MSKFIRMKWNGGHVPCQVESFCTVVKERGALFVTELT